MTSTAIDFRREASAAYGSDNDYSEIWTAKTNEATKTGKADVICPSGTNYDDYVLLSGCLFEGRSMRLCVPA